MLLYLSHSANQTIVGLRSRGVQENDKEKNVFGQLDLITVT